MPLSQTVSLAGKRGGAHQKDYRQNGDRGGESGQSKKPARLYSTRQLGQILIHQRSQIAGETAVWCEPYDEPGSPNPERRYAERTCRGACMCRASRYPGERLRDIDLPLPQGRFPGRCRAIT